MTIRISVAVALASKQEVLELELPEGSTVGDAIAAAEVSRRYPGAALERARVGIWSRLCDRATKLRDGDRVELYRPLVADAKQMRRLRARAKR